MIQANIVEALHRKIIPILGWEALAMNRAKWALAIRDDSYHSARVKVKRHRVKLPFWTKHPHCIIGCYVEKRFGSKWFLGRIVSVDVDEATHDVLWKIDYDDGDFEDCNRSELQKILCLDMHAIV